MVRKEMLAGCALLLLIGVRGFQPRVSRSSLYMSSDLGSDGPTGPQDVRVEIFTRRTAPDSMQRLYTRHQQSKDKNGNEAKLVAFDTVYKEYKEDRVANTLDSPVVKFLGVLLNPTSMLLILYLSSIGWSRVLWLQRFLSIFGRGVLVNKEKRAPGTPLPEEELPFQIFECEVCKLEMRPARGRADIIFGRPRFRCSRCGAKADAFFDVDDMSDPRATERAKRLEDEANAEWGDDEDEYDDEGGEDYDEDEDD